MLALTAVMKGPALVLVGINAFSFPEHRDADHAIIKKLYGTTSNSVHLARLRKIESDHVRIPHHKRLGL
jgi:hypothetical protein